VSAATCAHHAAINGQLPMLQWIVEEAGLETLRVATSAAPAGGGGVTPVMDAVRSGHLDVVQWIVSQLGLDCVRATSNNGCTAAFGACGSDHPAAVQCIFDVLGGAALRVAKNNGQTPLQCLESHDAGLAPTQHTDAQQTTLAHLKVLLAVPEELPELLQAQRRLALAHPHLGAASSAAAGEVDVVQMVAMESGVLGERASYHDIKCWGEEHEEEDRAYLQRVLSNVKSPKARRLLQAAVIAQLPKITDDSSFSVKQAELDMHDLKALVLHLQRNCDKLERRIREVKRAELDMAASEMESDTQ